MNIKFNFDPAELERKLEKKRPISLRRKHLMFLVLNVQQMFLL